MGTVRISCATFVRVRRGGQYGLLVNRDQFLGGRTVLSPIGGAMQVGAAERDKIMRQLNLTLESFDKPPVDGVVDLRFRVEEALLPKVYGLYPTWNADPTRELHEELGPEETGIFTSDELAEAAFKVRFAGVGREIARTQRRGQAGQETHRLVSVYDLTGNADAIEQLWTTDFPFFAVTAEEIKKGQTEDGIEIAPISSKLIAPKKRRLKL